MNLSASLSAGFPRRAPLDFGKRLMYMSGGQNNFLEKLEMSQITGGSFKYLRRVKTGDYEHHEAEAEINFSVDPDDPSGQSLLDQAAVLATVKVNAVLGARPVAPVAPATAPAAAPVPPTAPARRGRPPKPPVTVIENITPEEIAEAKAERDPAAITEEQPNISANPENRQDPKNPDPASVEDFTAAPEKDPAAIEDFTAAPEITDAVILDALQKRQAAVGDVNKIRSVLGKYLPTGKGYKDLPKEVRQNFLDDLAALQ